MKPVVTAVLVFVAVFVLLSASVGVANHLGYISFEDEPSHVQPSQGFSEPNQQGPILGASVVVPAAFSLPLAAKIAISITVILVLAGLAVGAYFLWQNYQDDIIRVFDPESYNQKLEKARLDEEQRISEELAQKQPQEQEEQRIREEQEKQAAAERFWKVKLISLGACAAAGIISAIVLKFSHNPNLSFMSFIYSIVAIAIVIAAIFASWSLFFMTISSFVVFLCVTNLLLFLILACYNGEETNSLWVPNLIGLVMFVLPMLITLFV